MVATDTTYAMVAAPESHAALEAIRRLRRLERGHLWSLMCADLSQASRYVRMDNPAHRLLRRLLPGPYTFILPATSMVPRRLFGKRRAIGVRIPRLPLCAGLLERMDGPLLATTMQFPDEEGPACDPDRIDERICGHDAILLDAGWGGSETTTVVDLCGDAPELIRAGCGEWPIAR